MARLNPRDCWYWSSGTCLNKSCAFRHPVAKQSASPPTSRSPYEDAAAGSSISLVAAPGSVPRSPHVSSPGFDFLVDNGSEELLYEDDYNYVADHDGDSGDPVGNEYDFKENARDDPEYTGSGIFYEKERHDYDYNSGAQHSLERVREGLNNTRRRVLDLSFCCA